MMAIQAGWLGVDTPEVHPPDDTLDDGQLIAIGAVSNGSPALTGSILYTPGHTQGSVCLYLPEQNLLLAGDTLFAGVGRPHRPARRRRPHPPPLHPQQAAPAAR